MDETDRIASASAEAAAQEFVTAVARSMDELEKRIVDVTGIEGDDDDGLVVGRVTFSPEVERVRRGVLPTSRVVRGPLNRPNPELDRDMLEDIMDALARYKPKTGTDTIAKIDDDANTEMTEEELLALAPKVTPAPKTGETLGDGIDGGGKRMNAGKLRVELVPPEWLIALADVMTQGSKKYEPRNWEKGMKWSTMIGSMKRHIAKFEAGERYDGLKFDIEAGTTGCHHLAMIAWNALGLMSYDLRDIGTNDLPDDDGLKLFERVNAMTTDKGNSIHDK